MLATIHTLPLPDRQEPETAPALEVRTAHAAAPPVGARTADAIREAAPPAASIRLRRVTAWPSGLPKLLRPMSKSPRAKQLRDRALRDEPPRDKLQNEEPPRTRRRELARLRSDDRGAVTAEYAVVILAAVAFAGLLVAILRSEEVRAMLLQLVQNALGSAG